MRGTRLCILSIAAFFICWWLFRRFDPPEASIEVGQRAEVLRLRHAGWLVPLVLSVVVFFLKLLFL
ncbi:hypothetical protein [Paenibacillus sp. YYML68]|uniref:hypothetical protein n=1 Tax=Paenibacillus sp. YYML68 TaxID=2909250 RepID=UPI0024929CD5|nr:hypothetical protein [Paenibacillus sp. YYML68]